MTSKEKSAYASLIQVELFISLNKFMLLKGVTKILKKWPAVTVVAQSARTADVKFADF